jgi:hypothetical protein
MLELLAIGGRIVDVTRRQRIAGHDLERLLRRSAGHHHLVGILIAQLT